LVYDGDVVGGVESMFRAYDGTIPRSVKSLSVVGNVVTLTLDRRITGTATVSYGFSTSPESDWVRDTAGIAVPCFGQVPVTP
jgi:hypothetical protein